jgi:hypothetical protein
MLYTVETAMPIPYEAVRAFCEGHHIVRLWLFGSVLRDDFRLDSDVDVLVEFDPAHIPGWEFYGTWREQLEAIFGRPVDLGTPDSLRPRIRQQVMHSARLIYERL